MLVKDSHSQCIGMLLAIMLCACHIGPVMAQRTFAFRHVGIDSGLSHERVNSVTVGSKGFMWVSAMWALDNYDGYTITSVAPPDTLLRDGELLGAQEFGGDTMIVRSTKGYLLLIRSRMAFVGADSFLRSKGAKGRPGEVWVDGWGNIWMLEGREIIYSPKRSSSAMRFHLPKGSEVSCVCGSRYGLVVLLRDGRLLRCYPPADGQKPTPQFFSTPLTHGACAMRTDLSGDLWVITPGGDSLWHKPMSRRSWELANSLEGCKGRLPGKMIDVCVDTKKRVWIASESEGAAVIDPGSGKTYTLRRDPRDPYGLRSNQCTCVNAFANGSVAIGYAHSGFSIYSPSAYKLLPIEVEPATARKRMTDVRCVATDGRENAYVGTNGGDLIKIDIATHEATILPFPGTDMIDHAAATRDGSVWVFVNGKGFARYCSPGKSSESKSSICYFGGKDGVPATLSQTEAPGIVASTHNGSLFAAAGSKILALPNASDRNRLLEGSVTAALDEDVVTLRAGNDSSSIIILTRASFYKARVTGAKLEINRLTDYDLWHDRPSDICMDEKGDYWVSTSRGVLLFKGRGANCSVELTDQRTLPQPPISMAPDGRRGVIAATPTDLYTLYALPTEENGSLRIATGHYRAAGERYSGINSPRAACLMPDGKVWIGSELGVNEYIPSTAESSQAPSVEFSQLLYKGKYVMPGQEIDGIVALSRPLQANRHVTLPYTVSSFTVTFTAVPTPVPHAMSYSCEVIGLRRAKAVKSEPRFALHNLPPGHYTLRVTATTPDGRRSSPSDLDIDIVQPWYAKTTTTVAAIAMCVIMIIIIAYRSGLHRGKRKGLCTSGFSTEIVDSESAKDSGRIKNDDVDTIIMRTVAANVATSIGVLSDDLRSVSQTAGISIADSLSIRNLADRLNTANTALASVTEHSGIGKIRTGSQFGGLGRHDLVALVRAITKQVSSATHSQATVSFTTPLKLCVFDFNIEAFRTLLMDIIVEAIVSTAGAGFVSVKVEKDKYAPDAATVTVSIGGTQSAPSIYFTSDSDDLALPAHIEECSESLGADIITQSFGDGMTHVHINIPMKERGVRPYGEIFR